jgi:hypothetical protein
LGTAAAAAFSDFSSLSFLSFFSFLAPLSALPRIAERGWLRSMSSSARRPLGCPLALKRPFSYLSRIQRSTLATLSFSSGM